MLITPLSCENCGLHRIFYNPGIRREQLLPAELTVGVAHNILSKYINMSIGQRDGSYS